MTRRAFFLLVALGACNGGGSIPAAGGPVAFRVLHEGPNASFCVEGPDFVVAADEDAWVDAFDMHTECRPEADFVLPEVDFGAEVGVVAWWAVVGCLGYTVRTVSIERRSTEVVVSGVSTGPSPGHACAAARAGLESLLALKRSSLYDGTQPVRFVLDGKTVGGATANGAP